MRLSKCRPSWPAFFIRSHMALTGRHRRHGGCATYRASPNAEDITADVATEAAREPASIGHLRAGRPETRANTGLAGRVAGNAHSTRASGHAYCQHPIHVGHKPIMTKQRSVPLCRSHRGLPLPGTLHLAIPQKRVPRQSCMIACLPNHCAKRIFTTIRHVTHPAPRRSRRSARHARSRRPAPPSPHAGLPVRAAGDRRRP